MASTRKISRPRAIFRRSPGDAVRIRCLLGIGISIGVGRPFVERPARSPTSPAPRERRLRALPLVRGPCVPHQRRSAGVARAGGAHGDAAVGRPRTPTVPAGERDAGGGTHGVVGASADGRGVRDGPRLVGARVDGGLCGPACVARAARVRRCARSWSITDACVMNATRRSAPWQVGHASGSTSTSCWSNAACRAFAHRRLAPPSPACHGGGWHTSHNTAW